MTIHKGILLFNPRSANSKARIPNSILSLAASLDKQYDWVIVDGNLEKDPWQKIQQYLNTGKFRIFGCTVMPGIQIRQAIPYSKKIRQLFPEIFILWGGYFPQAHTRAVLESGFVDCIVKGPGNKTLNLILDAIDNAKELRSVSNITFYKNGEIQETTSSDYCSVDLFPELPYNILNKFYPLSSYIKKTILGKHTFTYHSSFGCPFTCSFCAIPNVFHAGWMGCSASRMADEIIRVKNDFNCDAVEFTDNNFFVSEKRISEFCSLIQSSKISWWAEGRADTLLSFSNETLLQMRNAGCKMIFMGAESGNAELLKHMGKGGTQDERSVLTIAKRLKEFNIIPEFSFVLGLPEKNAQILFKNTQKEIRFIRKIKEINPDSEIVIYVYSPLPGSGNELLSDVSNSGLQFPNHLEDWLSPDWIDFDLRRNPQTPWLNNSLLRKIRDFETVLNGYFPSLTDINLAGWKRKVLRFLSLPRYVSGFYWFPFEIKILLRFFRYRRPEKEGF